MEIKAAILERKRKIEQLQREIAALEFAESLLAGKTRTEKPKTQADMASTILEDIGKPLHVSQLVSHIKKSFGETVKSNNLSVMLFRYAKRGNRFYKVQGRPNTYGLVKWQGITESIKQRLADAKEVLTAG